MKRWLLVVGPLMITQTLLRAGALTDYLTRLQATSPDLQVIAVDAGGPTPSPLPKLTKDLPGVAEEFGYQAVLHAGIWLVARSPDGGTPFDSWRRQPALAAGSQPLADLARRPISEWQSAVPATCERLRGEVHTAASAALDEARRGHGADWPTVGLRLDAFGPEVQELFSRYLRAQSCAALATHLERAAWPWVLTGLEYQAASGEVTMAWAAVRPGLQATQRYGLGRLASTQRGAAPLWSRHHTRSAGEWERPLAWRGTGPVSRLLSEPPKPLRPLAAGTDATLLVAVRAQPAWAVWQGLVAVLGLPPASDRPAIEQGAVSSAWFRAHSLQQRLRWPGLQSADDGPAAAIERLTEAQVNELRSLGDLPGAQLSAEARAALDDLRARAVTAQLAHQMAAIDRLSTGLRGCAALYWPGGLELLGLLADGSVRGTSLSVAPSRSADLDALRAALSLSYDRLRITADAMTRPSAACPSRFGRPEQARCLGESGMQLPD